MNEDHTPTPPTIAQEDRKLHFLLLEKLECTNNKEKYISQQYIYYVEIYIQE